MESTRVEAAEMPAPLVREGREDGGRMRSSGPLVARPLRAPAGLSDIATRRWELFAPALNASLLEAVQAASEALLADADETAAADRRRLAFAAARALHGRLPELPRRIPNALAQLFLAPTELETAWRDSVGAFAFQQLADRLLRGDPAALAALGHRLHGERGLQAEAVAARLAGLLDQVIASDSLPTHARNVVCAFFARRMEAVIPGLAGQRRDSRREAPPTLQTFTPPVVDTTALPTEVEPPEVPRALEQALTRLQQQALDDASVNDLARSAARLVAASRVPVDQAALGAALERVQREEADLDTLLSDRRIPAAVAAILRRLLPILARSAVRLGGRHPGAAAFVATLVKHALDLSDPDRDQRADLIEDLCGEALVRFVDDDRIFCELLETAHSELAALGQRQREVRTRARDRAAAERRRVVAREAAEAACSRLLQREGLRPLVEGGWRNALQQAYLRYGAHSAPWQRLLTLGNDLLTADRDALETLRPAIADALGLALPDATDAERVLERVLAEPGEALDPTELPHSLPPRSDPGACGTFDADLPLLLADGRRRWVLMQAGDADGEVLLGDALARKLEWIDGAALRLQVERGETSVLDAEPLLEDWLGH
jgi:hypothetical protein